MGPDGRRAKSPTPLPVPEALDVMEKVLEAIEYAHSKSVIHRDLKPASLMRTKTRAARSRRGARPERAKPETLGATARKLLPARISREEDDDDAALPRVERVGPEPKPQPRNRR